MLQLCVAMGMESILDYQPCKEAGCDKHLGHGLAMYSLIHNCGFLNFFLPGTLISEAEANKNLLF